MIRCNAVSDASYYLHASGEMDTPWAWQGRLSGRLGLSGVDHDAFRKLMRNRTPDGSKLTAMDHPDRRLGYDLTFAEPKSVSLMEQLAGDTRIAAAREASVREIMEELVEPLAATRDRRLFGFRPVETGNLAWTGFYHRLGRPVGGVSDPNGHVHVVLPNATERSGRHLALEIRPIKEAMPLIQAAWHANFAGKLRELGYGIRPTRDGFEIAGVADATIRKFSRRSELIELEAKRREIKSPKGKAALGALTREKKLEAVAPEKLHAAWEMRLTPTERAALAETHRKAVEGREGEWADRSTSHLRTTLHGLLRAESAVPEEKLLTEALKRGVGEVSLAGLQSAMEQPGIVRGKAGGVSYLTTPECMEGERQVVDFALQGRLSLKRVKRGEKVESMERLPGFEALRERVSQAADSGERLRFYVPGYRLYSDKAQRGSPAVWLEDFAGLKTGQERPKVKLARKVAKVSRKLAAKLKRQVTRVKQFEAVRSMVERQLDGRARDVARGYER